MKRKALNKIIGALSVYYSINLFQVIEVSEVIIIVLKTRLKKLRP